MGQDAENAEGEDDEVHPGGQVSELGAQEEVAAHLHHNDKKSHLGRQPQARGQDAAPVFAGDADGSVQRVVHQSCGVALLRSSFDEHGAPLTSGKPKAIMYLHWSTIDFEQSRGAKQ